MKKLLAVILLCLPVFGQTVYSGPGYYSGSAAYGAPVCGPPNYSCFSTSTAAVPLPNPIPSWGPNTCDNTSPYTMQNCGNLTGAGTVQTPSDFGNAMGRCTDANTVNASILWVTADNGEVNLFAADDSWVILKTSTGTRYIAQFDPVTMHCSITGISYVNTPAIADHSSITTVYTLGGTYGTQLYANAINPAAGTSTPTLLYDFLNSSCLTNSYNGNPSWTAKGWTGMLTNSMDDATFSIAFGDPNSSGKGSYAATWKKSYGLNGGCDIFNTTTGLVLRHDGTQVGTIALSERWNIHEVFSALNPNYAIISAGSGTMLVGSYIPGYWIWQPGTLNIVHCGTTPVPPGYYCDGHEGSGYLGLAAGGSNSYHTFADPSLPLTKLVTANMCDDNHMSWNYNDTLDSYPVMNTAQEVGATVNLLNGATPPCPYYDEIFFAKTDGTGTLRAAHTFNSGWNYNFGVQNAIGIESGSGKFAIFQVTAGGTSVQPTARHRATSAGRTGLRTTARISHPEPDSGLT